MTEEAGQSALDKDGKLQLYRLKTMRVERTAKEHQIVMGYI